MMIKDKAFFFKAASLIFMTKIGLAPALCGIINGYSLSTAGWNTIKSL
jgi:hypothetical protein